MVPAWRHTMVEFKGSHFERGVILWGCSDMRLRRKRDFSVRIPTLKLPFRLRVQ